MKTATATALHVAARLPECQDARTEHALLLKAIRHPARKNVGSPEQRERGVQYTKAVSQEDGMAMYLCRVTAGELPPSVASKAVTLTVTEGDRVVVRFRVSGADKGQKGPARTNFHRHLSADELQERLASYAQRMGLEAERITSTVQDTILVTRWDTAFTFESYGVTIIGKVRDPQALIDVFLQGIGKFRTYGMGMIMVEHISSSEAAVA